MKRPYRQNKRAEAAAETRRRIVEATVELHRTVGPRHTTVAEVARRAGVERLTVYNHFPEEADMVRACQGHWLGLHPPPDRAKWAETVDPELRLRAALWELFSWFEETEEMTSRIVRDAPDLPSFAFIVKGWQEQNQRTVAMLSAGRVPSPRLEAALRAVISFATWQTMCRHTGLAKAAAVELAIDWVRAAEN